MNTWPSPVGVLDNHLSGDRPLSLLLPCVMVCPLVSWLPGLDVGNRLGLGIDAHCASSDRGGSPEATGGPQRTCWGDLAGAPGRGSGTITVGRQLHQGCPTISAHRLLTRNSTIEPKEETVVNRWSSQAPSSILPARVDSVIRWPVQHDG